MFQNSLTPIFGAFYASRSDTRAAKICHASNGHEKLVCWYSRQALLNVHVELAKCRCVFISRSSWYWTRYRIPPLRASHDKTPNQHANMHENPAEDIAMKRYRYLTDCHSALLEG